MMAMRKWKFPNVNLSLTGTSRAAHGTALYIPELKWGLDAGIGGIEHIFTCFVTHGHLDHTLVIPGIVSAYSVYGKAAQIYVPQEIEDFAHSFVQSSMEMNWGEKIDPKKGNFPKPYCDRSFPYPYDIFAVKPTQEFKVDNKHTVEIFACDHSVACVGYGFFEIRQKMKSEYKDLPKNEIINLRKNGVEITENVKLPLFAFLGDTTHRVFDMNDSLLNYPVIIVECTFLYDEHLPDAEKSKHAHWNNLRPIIEKNKQCTFVLIHFSLRYTDQQVLDFFEKLPEKVDNIVVFVPESK